MTALCNFKENFALRPDKSAQHYDFFRSLLRAIFTRFLDERQSHRQLAIEPATKG
jgi:hypothetical protein